MNRRGPMITALLGSFLLLVLGVRWDDASSETVAAAALLGAGLLALASLWDRP